jgi:hypothetical protein
VYRPGATAGAQSYWYAWRSSNAALLTMPWGQAGDVPCPGDYDGDDKVDFCIQRDDGGSAVFHIRTALTYQVIYWGLGSDVPVPGNYDGDFLTDVAVVRASGGVLQWHIRRSSLGYMGVPFGLASDRPVQGDYDGDGKTDIAVWRADPNPALTAFYVRWSSDGSVHALQFGQSGDYPVANFNTRYH